ncbi:MAG TPA: hypothetical protein VEA80_14640 [Vitreimonas sp.]|nr:hypothetical protein [Vitreimonas sp.]HYD88709.1 hypothetical protein [Vitreimonas sp.]
MAAFTEVAACVTTQLGSARSIRSAGIGFGVVVTTSCGASPMRRPMRRIASVSLGRGQMQNSSAHAASNCGPRRRSGSSAENAYATEPFGQVSRRREGS